MRGAVRGRGEGGDERGGATGFPAHVLLSYGLLTYLLMAFVLHGFECVAQCLGGQRGAEPATLGCGSVTLGRHNRSLVLAYAWRGSPFGPRGHT